MKSGKESKAFFSEEKKQKTFGRAVAEVSAALAQGDESFYFSKKNRLLRQRCAVTHAASDTNHLGSRRVTRKQAIFEEEPKNFYPLERALQENTATARPKVFCFFSSEKKALPFLPDLDE